MSLIQGEKNQIIIKPFIYGSVAINLGRKSKEEATHKWCVYVRGVHNENISNFIKSVKFTLHDTFQNNIRIINKWPFELYETGWGEFDIKIQIHLIDETVKPIDLAASPMPDESLNRNRAANTMAAALSTSPTNTTAAALRPMTRPTLVVPGLPEPLCWMSMPRLRATIHAKLTAPAR